MPTIRRQANGLANIKPGLPESYALDVDAPKRGRLSRRTRLTVLLALVVLAFVVLGIAALARSDWAQGAWLLTLALLLVAQILVNRWRIARVVRRAKLGLPRPNQTEPPP